MPRLLPTRLSQPLRLQHRRGFTLIELAIGVAIVTVLSLVILPRMLERKDDGGAAETLRALDSIRASVESYRTNHGVYPSHLFNTLSSDPLEELPKTTIYGKDDQAVIIVTGPTPIAADNVTDTGGWLYNPDTGEVRINITGLETK